MHVWDFSMQSRTLICMSGILVCMSGTLVCIYGTFRARTICCIQTQLATDHPKELHCTTWYIPKEKNSCVVRPNVTITLHPKKSYDVCPVHAHKTLYGNAVLENEVVICILCDGTKSLL